MTLSIQSKYFPRPYQLPILKALNSGIKRAIWVCHRRAGKDITIFNWVIEQLIKEVCTCYYILPKYSQAKKVIWDATNNDGFRILDYFPQEIIAQKNQQEMKIRLSNGSLFQLIGSDNIDSLMGTNPKIVVFSEYALQTTDAWDFIRPILKVNGGTAVFISTPRGRNHFHDLYQMALTQPDWFTEKLTYKDTGFLTDEDIEKEKLEGMSEELIEQEYLCSFDRGIDGAYYAKLMTKMYNEERIHPIAYDPYKLVHVAFDLGWDDCTSIIFFQIDGDRINIIDCEEHSNKTLHWYKELLQDKKYKYGTYLFPHDVEHVDGLSTGLSRKEILEDMQIPVTVVKRSFIVDGIEAVRVLLSSRIHIDSEKCGNLIKSLENYHQEWDEKRKVYSGKPCHDSSSHYCFKEDTKITTSKGKVKIKDVKIGDKVLTPFGYRNVLGKHRRTVTDICDVYVNNKYAFSSTPEHDIFTNKGIVKCDALRYNTLEKHTFFRGVLWKMFGYFYEEKDTKGFKKTISSRRTKKLSSLMDSFIDGTDSISEEASQHTINQVHYIELFGLTIMERFRKVWRFITKTMINVIMKLKILSYCREEITKVTMPPILIAGVNQMNAHKFCEIIQKKQKNGIDQKKEWFGIKSMQKIVFPFLEESGIQKNVKYVEKTIQENKHGKDSVRINAKQNSGLGRKSTMKKGFAVFAMKLLRSISMLAKQHVVTNVELQKCDIPNTVYDLTIEIDNCYYANDYLVSNCDSLRYLAEGLKLIDNGKHTTGDEIKEINRYWGNY